MMQPNTRTLLTKPTLEKIIQAVCQHFGITEEDLMEKSTASHVTHRRALCFYLIKEHVVISYDRIAQRFGFSSHSTVSRMVENVKAQLIIYAQTKHEIAKIMAIVNTL